MRGGGSSAWGELPDADGPVEGGEVGGGLRVGVLELGVAAAAAGGGGASVVHGRWMEVMVQGGGGDVGGSEVS